MILNDMGNGTRGGRKFGVFCTCELVRLFLQRNRKAQVVKVGVTVIKEARKQSTRHVDSIGFLFGGIIVSRVKLSFNHK